MVINIEKQISMIKYYCDSFIKRSGDINKISVRDPEYDKIKNTTIVDESGKRLTMAEKFKLVGLNYKQKRKTQDENVSFIKTMLDEFTQNGGDVNGLGSKDKIYHKIKDITIFLDSKKLSVEEKFALAGHKRIPKYNNYEKINDILDNLSQFEDEKGYVDSYRKNDKTAYYIRLCSSVYQLPESIIVSLLADKKLKKYYLNVNRFEYLKVKLEEYLETHSDFIGIKRNAPDLYEQLCSLKKCYPTKTGEQLSMSQLIAELGFDSFKNKFAEQSNAEQFNEHQFLDKYKDIIIENQYTISISDIDYADYMNLTKYLCRTSSSLENFFANYGVKYMYPKNNARNNLVSVYSYPFLEEMQQERDKMLEQYFQQYPQMQYTGKASLFTIRLKICQDIYNKYKNKIHEKYNSQQVQHESTEKTFE